MFAQTRGCTGRARGAPGSEGLRHRGDEGLCFRELQSQLLFQQRCHCSFLLFRVVARPFLLLRAGRRSDEEQEIIRVPDGDDDRESATTINLAGMTCPPLRRLGQRAG